ncbi:MAG: hypothetical protein ABIP20_05340 [Chthoniobacteraceae bacterium]
MSGDPQQPGKPGIREILTDALRFWEWRRLFYNLVLAAVVLVEFARLFPFSKCALQFDACLTLFLLAVLANAAYCAAYLVELLVQFSEFRDPWRRHRMVLWLLGTVFAAVLAHFFSAGMFAASGIPAPQ